MLDGEKGRDDRIDLVTVATPNATHYEITKAFLEAGFHVLCEKPMTMTVSEGEDIVRTARDDRKDLRGQLRLHRLFAGAPHEGDGRAWGTGQNPLVKAEFAHGHHADAADADNPRVRWRYDPAQAGVSAQFADCGIHALHMASFVTGQEVEKLSADTVSCISSRELEDDAMVNFRMDGGTVGRLWTSSIAIGRQHGLTLQVFGEKGGLRWAQEQPNQLYWMPLGGGCR
jgi:predicted dehydrogenase